VNSQVWWFVARSSGIIAWALLTWSVCWGLLMSTRLLSRRVSPAWLLDLHRHLGGLAVIFTAVHVVGLVADSYVTFGWAEILVPMASSWKPGAVAFGVVSFYLLLAVELTSLAMRRLPRSWWRWIHRSSFVLFGVATYHGIAAGTDAGNPVFRVAAWGSIAVVAALTIWLIVSARRTRTRLRALPATSVELIVPVRTIEPVDRSFDAPVAAATEAAPGPIAAARASTIPVPDSVVPVMPTPVVTPAMVPRTGRLSPIAAIAPITPIEPFAPEPSVPEGSEAPPVRRMPQLPPPPIPVPETSISLPPPRPAVDDRLVSAGAAAASAGERPPDAI
jgi:DMSO/TMAO reductase YedYZ heme-binding membrane subunit